MPSHLKENKRNPSTMKARNRRMNLLPLKNPPLKKLELPQAVLLVDRQLEAERNLAPAKKLHLQSQKNHKNNPNCLIRL